MYKANEKRYDEMRYLRCGRSGLLLPRVALGLWHNFGSCDRFDNMKEMLFSAFDNGITHFDLANNYGPVPGSAESNLGRIMESVYVHIGMNLLFRQRPVSICGRGLMEIWVLGNI